MASEKDTEKRGGPTVVTTRASGERTCLKDKGVFLRSIAPSMKVSGVVAKSQAKAN